MEQTANVHKISEKDEQDATPDYELTRIIENVFGIESEKAKEIFQRLSDKDKQAIIERHGNTAKEKSEEDNIMYLDGLEKKLGKIDESMQKIFVVGDYKEHYKIHEKVILYVFEQLGQSEKILEKINAQVGMREAEKVMVNLESEIKDYKKKYETYKEREENYKSEIAKIKASLRNDKADLNYISNKTDDIEKEIEKMEKEEIELMDNSDKKWTEEIRKDIEKMNDDVENLYANKASISRRVNQNSALFSWKEALYIDMATASDESQHVLEQVKSHYEITKNMFEDHKKCGIAIEIKNGRILLRDIRKMQEGLMGIQKEFSETMVESTMVRRNYSSVLSGYNGADCSKAKNTLRKMQEEECNQAYKNLDRIMNKKRD